MECAHTIGLPIDRAFVEDHHILRQSSCLVREHIFNLAKFFIESGSASLCWDVLWCIKHLSIPVDIVTVAQSYYFNTKEKKRKKWSWSEQDKQIYYFGFLLIGPWQRRVCMWKEYLPWVYPHTDFSTLASPLQLILLCKVFSPGPWYSWLICLRHTLLPPIFWNVSRKGQLKIPLE